MAITTARVYFGGAWHTLTQSAETGFYETILTAPAAPGYVEVQVEVTKSDGQRAVKAGTLLIKSEVTPPTVAITTAPGFYQNPATPIAFTLLDEPGGSGVNLGSLKMVLDGQSVTGAQAEAIENGYACTYTPSGLSDGGHTITITVEDASGNLSQPASLTWSIDSTAPALAVSSPPEGLNTNSPALTIAGTVEDEGSGLAGLTLNGDAIPVFGGAFAADVTLEEGENTFTLIASDNVGNTAAVTRSVLLDTAVPVIEGAALTPNFAAQPPGSRYTLTATLAPSPSPKSAETVSGTVNGAPVSFAEGPALTWTASVPRADGYDVRLTASDAAGNAAQAAFFFPDGLQSKLDWTEQDFLNFWDLNRVERNTDFILAILRSEGYAPQNGGSVRDWAMQDIPQRSQIDRVRGNVDALQEGFAPLPEWREILFSNTVDSGQLNAIEWDLQLLERALARMRQGWAFAGEAFSGEL